MSETSRYLMVRVRGREQWNNIGDIVEFRNEKYYHLGRISESPLDIPEDLDLTPFFQDTKLNMDQLRAYIHLKKVEKS